MAGLEDQANKRIETFSGGMKRRINIAAGILHRPRVLLMDEPTVGIDPQSRNHILETVRELNRAGMTVLYTSHYMEEVEALCDRIAIVDHGKVIAQGSLEELRALVGDEDRLHIELADEACAEALEAVRAVAGVSRANLVDSTLELFAPDAAAVLGGIVGAIARAGATVRSVQVVEPNLESVFLHLTGRALRD
jgi:ABC-2 type transport system ATP-binding protein